MLNKSIGTNSILLQIAGDYFVSLKNIPSGTDLFKYIAKRLSAFFGAMRRKLAGYKYGILANNLYISPPYVNIIFPAKYPKEARSSENYKAANLGGAVVKFQIVGKAQTCSRFYINYFLAFYVVKAVNHFAHPCFHIREVLANCI